MFQNALIIIFLLAVILFLVMRLTLYSHFRRIDLPGGVFSLNKKIMMVFQGGGLIILLLALAFLILTFYA